MTPEQFAPAVLAWAAMHGRHDLPWQQDVTPYRVWISEIMLQQTQVVTVIDYFQRFMQRFDDLPRLPAGEQDEVLNPWTGLGYYSRARNLHKTARLLIEQHDGQFPRCTEQLAQLPGIGRSTAGAIASLGMGLRAPILDGNVKRVLARYSALRDYPGTSAAMRQLWQLAEQLTPAAGQAGAYTQAMMDLGATLCTRSKPDCNHCPLQQGCQAKLLGLQNELPVPRPKKVLPEQHCHMLLLTNQQGEILLQQRPQQGLWGGLYSLPQLDDMSALPALLSSLQLQGEPLQQLSALTHTFSHFRLHIQPWQLNVQPAGVAEMAPHPQLWYNRQRPPSIGLAAPVKKLLNRAPA
ncbi:MAG: A/G-specific adenine glycosylase [Thiopseudomonas sp.]